MNKQLIDINPVSVYDWQIKETEDNTTVLYAWCLNEQSESVLVRIEDYNVSCYLEIPEWSEMQIRSFTSFIRKAFKSKKLSFYPVQRQKLYYFNKGKLYNMLKINFESNNDMREFEKYITYRQNLLPSDFRVDGFIYKLYETKISLVRKLLTDINMKYSGWFKGQGYEVEPEEYVSTSKYEYRIPYKNIIPLNEHTKTTYPYIMSIDIECYSSNPKAMPKKTANSDIIFAISCICGRLGDKERKRYMIAVGKDLKCANAEVMEVVSEEILLVELKKLINRVNPDILIGYNTLGFDYQYLDWRVKRTKIDAMNQQEQDSVKWGCISKLVGYECQILKKSWESSAFSFNEFYLFDMPGRISLDLFPIIKRDYKLTRYDLDTVSKNFLGRGKHPVKAKDIFELSKKYFDAFESDHMDENVKKEYIRVLDYCVEDSELVFDLLEKLSIWIGLVELSNIVGVSIVELFTRGQQIRCLSQIYDLTTRNNIVLDSREVVDDIPFAGGYVQEPIPGLYDNIICLDFASLYPSIIQAYNICYTTLVRPEKHDEIEFKDINEIKIELNLSEIDDGKDKDDDSKDSKDQKIIQNHRFVRKEVYNGILPRLVAKLVDERRLVRKQLEGLKDPIMKTILDKRQLALKISANSVFGFLGVSKGKLPLMEGAMSITAKGRELIQTVNDYISNKYKAKIVYNDTDSSMIDLGIKDTTLCNEWGHKLSEEISKLFPPPIKMEFEKAMRMLCIRKKKYAAFLVDKHGKLNTDPKKMLVRGIILARRDSSKWLQEVYSKLLYNVMTRNDMFSSLKIVYNAISDLVNLKLDIKFLITVKQLGGNYKSENNYLKVFSDRLAKLNQKVNAGDRLEYLIVQSDSKLLGERMVTPEMYFDGGYKLDILYYLDHLLKNPIDQLFSIGHMSELKDYSDFGYQKKRKLISVSNPILMAFSALKEGCTIEDIEHFFFG